MEWPLFILSKTATLVHEFAMGDLPLVRTPALVLEFAVQDLSLGRTLMMVVILCCCETWSLSP